MTPDRDVPPRASADASRRRRLWTAFVILNLAVVLAIGGAAELALVTMLNNPPSIDVARRALAAYYTDFDRAIIQFLPDCARYDAELGYTLRPGDCRFANREFDTAVRVNSLGLRDRETALRRPAIVTLGDSYTMGWGVAEEAVFPRVIEEACGTTVLNAGISSYGTAREARLLSRLDRSALEWIIIQYSDNDLRENLEFQQRGGRLVPMSEADYRGYQQAIAKRASYYPGKHLLQFIPMVGRRLGSRWAAPGAQAASQDDGPSEAHLFLHALSTAPVPAGARVLAFELNEHTRNDGRFAAEVRSELASGNYPEPWRSMIIVEPALQLTAAHYFALDGHISEAGHRALGQAVSAAIGCSKTKPVADLTEGARPAPWPPARHESGHSR
jgi:hypothetical protein